MAVTMLDVPRWLGNLDAIGVAISGALLCVVAGAAPALDVHGSAAAGLAMALGGFTAAVTGVRFAMTGLAVSANGIRVRRFGTTTFLRWSEVDQVEVTRAPHVWAQRWDALRVSTTAGRAIWVLTIRRPRTGPSSIFGRFVDETTKESYRSVDDVASALLDLRRARLAQLDG